MSTRRAALALVALLPSIALLSILGCEGVEDHSPTAAESATPPSASLVSAADITVNTTVDVYDVSGEQVADLPGPDGLVSLREAITAANSTVGQQVIGFGIPVSDPGFDGTVFTIRPLSLLPPLSGGGTTIDGGTQTAFSGNTNPAGPEIVLHFSLIGSGADGLSIYSANNVIHSLIVNGVLGGPCCGGTAIVISSAQASGNIVTGCLIGVDASGNAIVQNGGQGVHIDDGATNNRIGGTLSDDRNVISGNSSGVTISDGATGNAVQGNSIGTDITGTVPLGNRSNGIELRGRNNLVEGNIISGNRNGVMLGPEGAGGDNIIRGNFLGTDVTGTVALGNREDGIRVGSDGNIIEGNLLSGNAVDGVGFYGANNNVVRSNRIGTDINGNPSLGNGEHGVIVCCPSANGNRIEDNLIAGNVQEGVEIFEGLRNSILRNRILANGGKGIQLLGDELGPLPNDPGDVDTGPNELMNYPVLDLARATRGQLIVRGTIDTPDPSHVLIEFFANPVPTPGGDPSGHGEGAIFLGTARPDVHGRFTATLPPVSLGTLITATATDAAGNTSEFAANVETRRLDHSLP